MGLTETLNNLLELDVSQIMYIVFAFVILAVVIFVLTFLEKKFKEKYIIKKYNRNHFYTLKIKSIMKSKSSAEEVMNSLNSLARDFFKEAFNLSYTLEYSELIDEFRKRGKKEAITFSQLITELNYSGEKPTPKKIKTLINLFSKIVEKNKIQTDKEIISQQKKPNKHVKSIQDN